MIKTTESDVVSNTVYGKIDLLGQKFVVLCLKLLDNVLIVKQFLDGAVRLAE